VTAPTPEKIQRYEVRDSYPVGMERVEHSKPRETDLVYYSDHLRHLKLAQISVLEEMNAAMTKQNGGSFCNEESEWSNAKIAALRKEIEG